MKYEYAPLSIQPGDLRGVFSIRLLHLLPSADRDARLECQLVETQIPNHLREQSSTPPSLTHVQYQALSYTWGEPEFPKSLHVLQADGAPPASVINITENLYSALQNLRKPDKTLVLWVDAVCIDQANIPERNSQVSNIPQTYAEAAGVLVWLGTDDVRHDGRLCLSFFTELAALIASDPHRGQEGDRGSWRKRFEINQMVSVFLNSAQPRPIASFLARPWFRRRWIVQEVVLAKDVSVHCGEWSIQWDTFELALTELFENDKGGFSDEDRMTLRIMSRIRHAISGTKSQFPLDTLVEFANFVCANSRDRLYALYGVIQHWFPGSPDKAQTGSIDYALSVGNVFTNFAILMMRLNDILPPDTTYNPITHVLQLAAAIQQQTPREEHLTSEEVCEKTPSWVPDWTGALTNTPLNHSPTNRDASSGIPKRQAEILTSKHDTRLLVLTGLVYDIITANISLDIGPLFGAVHEAKATLNDFLCSVAKRFNETGFFGAADNNVYQPTGQHIIGALATALIANWEHTPANSYFAQHPRFPNDFLEQLGSSKHHLPEILHKWPAYVELVTITMRGRGLFLTKSGYIGVCAANVLAGDVVCILSDTRIPFILRPKGCRAAALPDGSPSIPDCYQFQNESQFKEVVSMVEDDPSAHCTFQLMGDAYVHGLMDGEAAKRLGSQLGDSLRILPIA
jgi:Heterokaryon incompatibility protein (HET)